ncbi:TetR/AcrR family transcriptional regulator [Streptomyces mutomycini]|uniref:TetR/AcrR family transcriptional regulator n=1 Tax=Streptomyces mutomycini TaxID=284036 RepID=A0ABW0B722_9ACTN|nr:TetR/AcrR family transcriptional regulator [Streptomyces mutomycini]
MSHAHTNLRRVPVQQRSADRLARILDAGASLLDEAGYEQLSTRAVADRAGVPIGSVYRFFPNKRALVDALAERNLEAYAGRVVARLETIPEREWRTAIDAVLDEYLAMKRSVAGFALVDFGPPVPVAGPLDAEVNRRVAGRLAQLLAGHLGQGREEDPGRARDAGAGDDGLVRTVLVCVQAADALLQLAFRADPAGDPGLIAETRVLLQAYLARVLE